MSSASHNHTQAENRLVKALNSLTTEQEIRDVLADLCTPREVEEMATRLEVATMLAAGHSYLDVSHTTGASSTTVSRVSKCLNGERGGYRLVLSRLDGSRT